MANKYVIRTADQREFEVVADEVKEVSGHQFKFYRDDNLVASFSGNPEVRLVDEG